MHFVSPLPVRLSELVREHAMVLTTRCIATAEAQNEEKAR
jgi:hypothetical protein